MRSFTFVVALVLSCISGNTGAAVEAGTNNITNATVVTIKQGTLEGRAEVSRNGRTFWSFKGIPYGRIPQRFNIAIPAEGWEGTRQAKTFGPACAQFNFLSGQFEGEEDCLTINVFTPNVDGSRGGNFPVMYYIHGGAFVLGKTESYPPEYFMDENVVLVSVAYRVGPLGFFNAGIKGASGNQGFKDVVLGLKWVQKNIASFGGDPNRVTIFGHSAGASAVSHLVASPMAKGLLHGAISQSGTGGTLFNDPEHEQAKKLAQAVDCPTSNAQFMVECLRRIRPETLSRVTAMADLATLERAKAPVVYPTIETYKEGDNDPNVLISENVDEIFDEGKSNKVPFIIGLTPLEGLPLQASSILLNPNTTKKLNEQWGRVLPQSLLFWKSARDPCVVSGKYRKAYFNNEPVSMETLEGLVNMYSDTFFVYPSRKVALSHAKVAPTYLYNFTKEVKISFMDLFQWWKLVNSSLVSKPPSHGDDLQFFFENPFVGSPIPKDSGEDYEFSVNIIKLWASFAETGKLNYTWGTQLEKIEPLNPAEKEVKWLHIDKELSSVPEAEGFEERMKAMDDICKDLLLCRATPIK